MTENVTNPGTPAPAPRRRGRAALLSFLVALGVGTLFVVGWVWLRHGQRPRRLTVIGGVLALAGLVLVLDLTGSQRVDLVGVLWGLAAAAE